MQALLRRFLRDDSGRGAAAVVLITGTALVIVPTVHHVGVKLAAVFARLAKALQ